MAKDYLKHIRSELDVRERLEMVAEEAAELSQAALKVIRAAKMSKNYTPVSYDDAMDGLYEEIEDVIISLEAFGIDVVTEVYTLNKIRTEKWKRWAERLGYKEAEGEQ